jgi:hypothetical protein
MYVRERRNIMFSYKLWHLSIQSPENSEENDVAAQQQQHATAAVAFATAGPGQEMLVHFNFNKDREGLFRPDEHAALQRCVSVPMS